MKFQKISCLVQLAGDKNSTVYRDPTNPVTYPELLVLRAVHGGEDCVTDLADVGETDDIDPITEFERLSLTYGKIADTLFPHVGGVRQLPSKDPTIPSLETVTAAKEASDGILAKRAKTPATPKAPTALPVVPSLDQLVSK